MKRILASEAVGKVGQEILLQGWIRLKRDHGKLIFLDLRDRTGLIQVVVTPKASENAYSKACELRPEGCGRNSR